MKKTITLAGHQSISIPAKNRFVGMEIEIHPPDPYPWATDIDRLRPFLVAPVELAEDWLSDEDEEAWGHITTVSRLSVAFNIQNEIYS